MLPPGNLRTRGRPGRAPTGFSGPLALPGPEKRAIPSEDDDAERCVHGRERRVLLAHGERSGAQAVDCPGRLARPRARLGRARGARRPDNPAHPLAAPARHRLPDPRRRPPVDLRSGLRPELARAPRPRSRAPDPGRGPPARELAGDGYLRPHPSAVGTHPGRRPRGRRGGAHRQGPPFPVGRRERNAHAGGHRRPEAKAPPPG